MTEVKLHIKVVDGGQQVIYCLLFSGYVSRVRLCSRIFCNVQGYFSGIDRTLFTFLRLPQVSSSAWQRESMTWKKMLFFAFQQGIKPC